MNSPNKNILRTSGIYLIFYKCISNCTIGLPFAVSVAPVISILEDPPTLWYRVEGKRKQIPLRSQMSFCHMNYILGYITSYAQYIWRQAVIKLYLLFLKVYFLLAASQ